MRLMECAKREVTIMPPKPSASAYTPGEHQYHFDTAKAITVRAVIQPLTGHTAALLYGQAISEKRRLLYDGDQTITLGMGVCVDVDPSAPCDYRVEELPARWNGFWNAVLALIPPTQRGA